MDYNLNNTVETVQKELTLLYVEDEESVREGYAKTLKRCSKELFTATDGQEGLELYKKHTPDIVVSDIRMPNMNGIDMAKAILKINPQQHIIFTTAHSENDYFLEAIDMQIAGYILKPVDKEKLKSKIDTISKHILLEKENIEQKNILQSIFDNQSSLTILTDFETLSFASKSFLNFYNLETVDEFFHRYDTVLDMFLKNKDYLNADNKDEFLSLFNTSRAMDKIVLLVGKDFDPKAFHIHIDHVNSGEKTLYVLSLTNISIMQKRNIETAHKAYTDGLTGVNNRNKFEEVFAFEFSQFKRYERSLSIAIIDIDHFKIFNDTYGHLVGDEVLIMLAQEIQNSTRESDVFARWGGEEFVLLMTETTIDKAKKVCDNLRVKIENLKHKTAGKVTSSFGVTQVLEDDTIESLFKRCDDALYKAKDNGRNRVEIG